VKFLYDEEKIYLKTPKTSFQMKTTELTAWGENEDKSLAKLSISFQSIFLLMRLIKLVS
jgi:hypothetical protein